MPIMNQFLIVSGESDSDDGGPSSTVPDSILLQPPLERQPARPPPLPLCLPSALLVALALALAIACLSPYASLGLPNQFLCTAPWSYHGLLPCNGFYATATEGARVSWND